MRGLEIPVIFLTAHNDERTLARAKQTSPLGFITKPYRPHELTAAIDALGKTTGRSVGQLLFSTVQASVAVNGLIGAEPAAEAGAAASRLAEDGFRCLKVKVGSELKLGRWLRRGPARAFTLDVKVGDESSPRALNKRVQAVREAVGSNVRLRIDANGTWQASNAPIFQDWVLVLEKG